MAWSVERDHKFIRSYDGDHWMEWKNTWSVTEIAPVRAGYIRLQAVLSTDMFQKNSAYVWYATDYIVCNGETIGIAPQYVISGNAGYTVTIEVPASWSGQRVKLVMGWTTLNDLEFTATAAYPSAVSAANGVFGGAIPITITPSVSGVRHEVKVTCAGNTETLLTTASDATTVTWTPAVATYAPLLPSADSASAVITCETFYNAASMGSAAQTVTVAFSPGSLAPVCAAGWAAASVLNEGAAQGFTVWIQGKSKAAVVFDSTKITCQYGASVAGCHITCDNMTDSTSPYETGVLPGTSAAILCTVTDSRGQSASETLTVSLLPYAPPLISAPAILRCDAQGDADENGQRIGVTATAVVSPLGGENSYSLTAATRTAGGTWSGETALVSGAQSVLGVFSPDTSYEVRVTLTDGLGSTAVFQKLLPTRRWAMKFRADGNGVAFGKAPEQSAALELSDGWKLVLHDAQGNTAYLDYARLAALLGTIQPYD